MNNRNSAMTLVEVLVALAIVGMLLAGVSGVLEVVMRNKWIGEDRFTFQDSIKRAFELISSDFRGAVGFAEAKSKVDSNGQGGPNDFFLAGVLTADYLQQIDDGGFWRGLANVYYKLNQDQESGLYKLIRTEEPFTKSTSNQYDYKDCVLADLLSCKFSASADNNWLDLTQWQRQNPQMLPSALKIIIETADSKTNKTHTFEHVVILPSGYQYHYKEKPSYAFR